MKKLFKGFKKNRNVLGKKNMSFRVFFWNTMEKKCIENKTLFLSIANNIFSRYNLDTFFRASKTLDLTIKHGSELVLTDNYWQTYIKRVYREVLTPKVKTLSLSFDENLFSRYKFGLLHGTKYSRNDNFQKNNNNRMQHYGLKILTILLIFSPFLAKAQRPSFKPSAHVLVYGSQIDGDMFGGYDKANFALYLETQRVNRKKLQWSLGIGFAQRGSFRRPDPENNIFTQYKVATNYLSVPLRFSTTKRMKNSKLEYYLSFGAEALTLVSAKESDENGPLENRAEFRRITADAILDLGLQQKEWTFYFTFRYSLLAARKLDTKNGNYDSNLYQLNNVAGVGIKRNF